jgi:hypothetical protein
LIDRKTLHARGLKQWDVNGKAFKSYGLKKPTTNDRLQDVITHVRTFFTPDLPRGWRREVHYLGQQSAPAAMSNNLYGGPPR